MYNSHVYTHVVDVFCDFCMTVRRTEPQRPPTGNSPKIIRRDPELPPSTLDQDNNTG